METRRKSTRSKTEELSTPVRTPRKSVRSAVAPAVKENAKEPTDLAKSSKREASKALDTPRTRRQSHLLVEPSPARATRKSSRSSILAAEDTPKIVQIGNIGSQSRRRSTASQKTPVKTGAQGLRRTRRSSISSKNDLDSEDESKEPLDVSRQIENRKSTSTNPRTPRRNRAPSDSSDREMSQTDSTKSADKIALTSSLALKAFVRLSKEDDVGELVMDLSEDESIKSSKDSSKKPSPRGSPVKVVPGSPRPRKMSGGPSVASVATSDVEDSEEASVPFAKPRKSPQKTGSPASRKSPEVGVPDTLQDDTTALTAKTNKVRSLSLRKSRTPRKSSASDDVASKSGANSSEDEIELSVSDPIKRTPSQISPVHNIRDKPKPRKISGSSGPSEVSAKPNGSSSREETISTTVKPRRSPEKSSAASPRCRKPSESFVVSSVEADTSDPSPSLQLKTDKSKKFLEKQLPSSPRSRRQSEKCQEEEPSDKLVMEVSSEDEANPSFTPSQKDGTNKSLNTSFEQRTPRLPEKAPELRSGKLIMEVSSEEEPDTPTPRKSLEIPNGNGMEVKGREASPDKKLKDQVSDLSSSIADVSLGSGKTKSRQKHRKHFDRNRETGSQSDARTKDHSAKTADSEVTVRRKGGGTIIETRPVFSDDAKYVYLNCGWGVRVFSVETGECVRVFDAFSKDFKVVNCFCWNTLPAALTSEGVFIAWDPRSGKIQQKVRMHIQTTEIVIDGFFIPCVETSPLLCLVIESKEHTNLRIFSGTNFKSLASHPLSFRLVGHPYKQHSMSIGVGPKEPFIAYIDSKKGIRVVNSQNKPFFKNSHPPDKYWNCIRAHPTEDTIAVGDSIGRIVVFRHLCTNNRPVNSVYHWHTLPVNEIAFTPGGSSMYSGGGELTLVKWNVENPQVRNFLPRMSADIVHIAISPYNQMVAVSTIDNGVQIITPTNKLQCILQQFSWSVIATEQEQMFPAGLLFDPRSRGLILNSRPGHLQLYSPHSETLTCNIDVTMVNYLTQERDKVIVNTQVTHSAVTSDGLWLATVETRYEPGLSLELRLKFWKYSAEKKKFVLATVIDMPHDDQVHSIKFSPQPSDRVSNEKVQTDYEVVLVSTGADRKMRLWSKTPIDSIYHKGDTWRCQNACFYRDQPCGPCSFSYDGSVLAVGFGAALTLWDVENVALKHSLATSTEHVKFVEFGRDESCNMLMCATESTVMAWDLLKLCLAWKIALRSARFVADPYSSFLAVFTVDNQWKILDAQNGEVVCTLNNDGKSDKNSDRLQKQQVLAAVFVPRPRPNPEAPKWMRNSYLYYIDVYQELNCLEPANEIAQLPKFQLAVNKDNGTLFGSLVGAKSVREKEAEDSLKTLGYGELGARAVTQLLGPAAHTLPPVNLLCGSFLQSFVILKRENLPDESDRDDKTEDDKTTVVASSGSEEEFSMPTFPAPTSRPKKSRKPRNRRPQNQKATQPIPEPMETDAPSLSRHFGSFDEDDDEPWRRKHRQPTEPGQVFVIDE